MKVSSTSDSPSWTKVSEIREEIEGIEALCSNYPDFPFNLGFCFRCLENDSGWVSQARFNTRRTQLGFDIVTYEPDYIPHKKNMNAQRKIIGREFHEFFPKTMKKYEKKFPVLKQINPTFLPQVEKWLKENGWID